MSAENRSFAHLPTPSAASFAPGWTPWLSVPSSSSKINRTQPSSLRPLLHFRRTDMLTLNRGSSPGCQLRSEEGRCAESACQRSVWCDGVTHVLPKRDQRDD